MSLSSLLNKVVSVQRPSITKDTSGGSIRSFADVSGATEVPAAIQPASHSERQKFGQRNLFITHVIYFDTDYGILRGDRISEPATGKFYVILSYQNQAGRDDVWAAHGREQMA